MTPQEQWDGPIQDAIPEHDAEFERVHEVTFFRPAFPTGGTVFLRPQEAIGD